MNVYFLNPALSKLENDFLQEEAKKIRLENVRNICIIYVICIGCIRSSELQCTLPLTL